MSDELNLSEFPVLETPRLRLREIRAEDAPEIYAIFGHPGVMTYYNAEAIADLAVAAGVVNMFTERFRNRTAIRWGIGLRDDGKLVGTCGYVAVVLGQRRAKIGYDVRQSLWKRGILSEALRAICRFGFDQVGPHSGPYAPGELLDNAGPVRHACR